MAGKTKKIPQQRKMTPEMVTAIQPFLRKMLTRYQQVADTGSSDRPDPICAKAPKDWCCTKCPVWGVMDKEQLYEEKTRDGKPYMAAVERNFLHCEYYLPRRPACVEDREDGIRVSVTGKNGGANLEAARVWGWEMVSWLEALKEEVG